MSEKDEIRSKKIIKAPSIREITFAIDEPNECSPRKEKSEKLYKISKKTRTRSSSNLKEHFKSRSIIDSSRNVLSNSQPSNNSTEDTQKEHVFLPPKNKPFKSNEEINRPKAVSPLFYSPQDKRKSTKRSTGKKMKTPRKMEPKNLVSIVHSSKYWAEPFTEPPPAENADDLFIVDDQESAELFQIQDFNVLLVYDKLFSRVPHYNFMGTDEEYGHILISITKDPVDNDGQVITTNRMGKRQLSERTLQTKLSGTLNSSVRFADEETKPQMTPTSPRSNESGIKRALTGFFLNKSNNETYEVQGYHHVLIRFKMGDKLIKMPTTKTKAVKNSKTLLHMLLGLSPPVPFDWDNVDFKETSIPYNLISNMEEKLNVNEYKFGVIYCKEGQSNDDEMLSNAEGSEMFEKFMKTIAKKIELKGWTGYNGGLDVINDSTGKYSYYTKFRGFELMFHVSTLLPHLEGDEQHVEKKRHIGNDVVVIVFQEGDTPFDPESIKSVFNHVFIVVRCCNENNDKKKQEEPQKNNNDTQCDSSSDSKGLSEGFSPGKEDVLLSLDTSSDEIIESRRKSEVDIPSFESSLHLRQRSNEDNLSSTDDISNISKTRRLSLSSSRSKGVLRKGKPQKFSRTMTEIQKARLSVHAKNRAQNPPPKYRIEIVAKQGVAESIPKLPDPPIFSGGLYLKEFLLTKLINCERAAYFSPHFSKPMERAREMLLKDLYDQSFK